MKKLIMCLILICGMGILCSFAPDKADEQVLKVYQMRISGKVDQAKQLLDEILSKDSTNAMAQYERSRLTFQRMIGGGGGSVDEMKASADKAVKYAPQSVIYGYNQANVTFLTAYMIMEEQGGKAKELVAKACQEFERVLSLKPDYAEAMLYLVEINLLPASLGGDSLKAKSYARKLSSVDPFYGDKAKAVLLPQSADRLKYWEELLSKNPKNPQYLREAGKQWLFNDDFARAENYFDKAISIDPSWSIFLLDLGRYKMMKTMGNKDLAKTGLPEAKAYFEKYLKSVPEPVVPLRAYTLNAIAMCERALGNQAEADKLQNQAIALDKYFSRAMGVPGGFEPPDQVVHHFISYFSPF